MSDNGQYDALLIGAGPSGSSAAALLAEHGADPLFVHHADYMRTIGTYGAERANEATTAYGCPFNYVLALGAAAGPPAPKTRG